MSQDYDHKKIEAKWQKEWSRKKIYKTTDSEDKSKFYVLDMFPYPSGEGLHVGHPKGYIATDILSRMKRMQGYNVLHPMGFDAFGLPAENYAIKMKTNPRIAVAKNVARYKKQLEIIGFDYDWSREVNTTDPKYYKWTQWIFLKLYEKGLAYESYEPINWCPSCKTGLANEDVEDGHCERCGTEVEKKPMRQWVLKITDYADRLLADLDTLDWPAHIKESQRNWIGRSEGAELDFVLKGKMEKIRVFTTRPDTLFGVTYVVLAPEHAIVTSLLKNVKNKDEVIKYVAHARMMTAIERTDAKKDKTGVRLDGVMAINPVNKEEVPVFVADYVLADYGTGAVMAVPAHDERDFAFAKKYSLPMREVVAPHRYYLPNPPREGKKTVTRANVHAIVRNPKTGLILGIKWKKFPWTTFPMGGIDEGEDPITAAKREVYEETGYKNLKVTQSLGGRVVAEYFAAHKDENRISHTSAVCFDLIDEEKDPLSADEDEKHEVIWMDSKKITTDDMTHAELDVWLSRFGNDPESYVGEGILLDSGVFSGKRSEEIKKEITKFAGGEWVTRYKLKDWVFSRQRYWGEPFPILHDGDDIVPVAEKDLPVVLPPVKSYEPSGTGESPLSTIDKWVNVKVGSGKDARIMKRETNTMPQWAGSSWYYLRYMDPKNGKALVDADKEKYWNQVDFYVGGAEHATRHLIYARFWHKFLYDIGVVSTTEPFKKLQSVGLIMGEDGKKMSKRFGNVVNPDEIVSTYGADTLRIYEMFMGPFDQAINWNTDSMIGSRRFIERAWKLASKVSEKAEESKTLISLLHRSISKVSDDISNIRLNTAISTLMVFSNALEKELSISRASYEVFLRLLAPFAPHVTEELWRSLGNKFSVHTSPWPVALTELMQDDEMTIVVQVNGKVRGSFQAPQDSSKEIIEQRASNLDSVKKWIKGKEVLKTIVIPGKLVNFVV
ncbi:MAG: leucine--tRNA ligase [Candidatus Taylorbacteria bacterium CG10_big_fil_rev_8_21_14_0_10_41_48]|uniref:Leucine--tRNA ligase n=1 Tax=Candidatus Taylorbacteria bacterium CG10_big_fil_rev_8_21_14_0_10_41_48 TaxID=1975024 RepID=A0A2M8LCE0_9BACT|nr:MAG: leucine--tRNA ligase [Candidatus Taylorbacteria bacterium CG10_big_fil_rev_8_21_14_0_10_41_48]